MEGKVIVYDIAIVCTIEWCMQKGSLGWCTGGSQKWCMKEQTECKHVLSCDYLMYSEINIYHDARESKPPVLHRVAQNEVSVENGTDKP